MKPLGYIQFFNHPRVSRLQYTIGAALTLLATGSLPAMAQDDVPVMARVLLPSSAEQGAVHIDESDLASPPLPTIFEPEEKPELAPFFRDSKFSAQARSFYLNRKKFDETHSEALALGGSLAYLSGYVADHFRVGAVGYTSQKL